MSEQQGKLFHGSLAYNGEHVPNDSELTLTPRHTHAEIIEKIIKTAEIVQLELGDE